MSARITIVTAGHLATCPRMLKAADALHEAGYDVRVVSTRHVAWATAADAGLKETRPWRWTVVNYDRATAAWASLRTAIRFRASRLAARFIGPGRAPLALASRAYARVHSELLRAALAEPTDLFYGGTTGALAVVSEAARTAGVPYGLDLEDFHSAERGAVDAPHFEHALAERIEDAVLAGARFLTASSDSIAGAYAPRLGVRPITIHNTFPLPAEPPDLTPSPGTGLRLYWFSQTVGPGRGLEDAVRAMGAAAIPGELHLRGRAIPEYLASLKDLAARVAPRLQVIPHPPASPDAMVALCRGYDVGLALEPGFSVNNLLALSNKAFTYLLGGLAVAFTDTPGQRSIARALGEGALLCAPGDIEALAAGLKRWADHKPTVLARARSEAWEAAARRWHWEHDKERGAVLRAVRDALVV